MATEESVKKRKDYDPKHERVVEWFALDDKLVWDTESESVVTKPTITGLANELGVSRQTIYNWARTMPDFKNRVKNAQEALTQEKVSSIWNRVFLKACSGDMRAADIWLSNFDPSYVSPRGKKSGGKESGRQQSSWASLIQKYSLNS